MFEQNKWYDKLPDESLAVYEPNLRLFFETMYERQMIWKRRFLDQQPFPWTENPILRDNKFTNVYRELDRNSQWQIKNIMLDEKLSLKNLVWKLMVFRFFNNPETFTFNPKNESVQLFNTITTSSGKEITVTNIEDIIPASKWRNGIPNYEEYNVEEFEYFIAGIRSFSKNPFTNAYLVNSGKIKGKGRDYYYTRVVIPALHKSIPELIKVVLKAKDPQEIIDFLCTLPCVANFIAHEFYQDFTYIPRYTDKVFMRFTQDDWTNVGPGASVGIRLIFPNLKGKQQKEGIYKLRKMACDDLGKIGREKGELMPYLYWDKVNKKYQTYTACNISLHQIEMWLCEFQKYWKMMIGEGKQRSKFQMRTKELIVK